MCIVPATSTSQPSFWVLDALGWIVHTGFNFTHYMLNCFKKSFVCIFVWCTLSALYIIQFHAGKEGTNYHYYSKEYSHWLQGDAMTQDISRHGTDLLPCNYTLLFICPIFSQIVLLCFPSTPIPSFSIVVVLMLSLKSIVASKVRVKFKKNRNLFVLCPILHATK